MLAQWIIEPGRVFVEEAGGRMRQAQRAEDGYEQSGVRIRFVHSADRIALKLHCPAGPLARVVLRWERPFGADTLYLGDHWERSYGDLQWRNQQPERLFPWYFAAYDEAKREGFFAGVATQPSALCAWTADAEGFSLWLDLRNGGMGSLPGDREIAAATVLLASSPPELPVWEALRRFCQRMCPSPRLPPGPVCGNNNWYYAYGKNFSAATILGDADLLADLSAGQANRPYCVVDAGWTSGGDCAGGPWHGGDPRHFPDMPGLAAQIAARGVKPGIWIRPTALSLVDEPSRLRAGPCSVPEKPLDLTLADNLAIIKSDIARLRSWGFELIKHDFSTYDALGRWGFEMGAEMTSPGWHFADRRLTNAEILLNLYRALREAAGDGLLLGCNTMGHLGAGIFEVQRTGDDTSGRSWERTRRMGVNALAFRHVQHRTFFACDPDCAAHTDETPWELDAQFLDLVARSGQSLFVSVDPRTITREKKAVFASALQRALSGESGGETAPLDWLRTTSPRRWRLGSSTAAYSWAEPFGTNPLKV